MIRSWIENQRSTFLKPSSWRNVALALSLSSATVAAQSEPRSLKPGSASAAPTAQAPTAQAPTAQAPTAQAPTAQAPTAQAPTAQAPRTATGADTAPNEGGQGEREQGVSLQLPIERYQLPNGLRVVLNPDTSSPTAAVCITYDVGSRNEQRGRSGFAHLFEHMMFQGSRNLPKGGHFTMIASRGGSLNGTTSSDRTNYFQVVPSNALATVLWLEADRMKSLAITQENFENQRRVVQEEYRMRVSNAAYAEGLMSLGRLAYGDYWPYGHDTIGSMEDLDNAQLEWLREFHKTYYAPNNAVLAVAGDFDREQTVRWIQEYFGDARPSEVPAYDPGSLTPQSEARRQVVQDTNARTPGLLQGWVIPPHREPQHYALEIATLILAYGDSSVLHQRLVRKESLLRQVAAWTYDRRGPDLLVIRSLLTERADAERVEAIIAEELDRLATVGPTTEELARAVQQVRSMFLFGLESNLPRSTQLSSYELFWGDANLLNEEVDNYAAVTAAAVQQAVATYLTKPRSSTVFVKPASPEPAVATSPVSEAPATTAAKEPSQP